MRRRPAERRRFAGVQKRPSILPLTTRIRSAAGLRGKPGIVRTSPISTTTKPAPARRRTSRIFGTCPVGAPMSEGSSENEYWVLATQTGAAQPAFSSSRNFACADASAAIRPRRRFRARLFGSCPIGSCRRDRAAETRLPRVRKGGGDMGESFRAGASARPMIAHDRLDSELAGDRALENASSFAVSLPNRFTATTTGTPNCAGWRYAGPDSRGRPPTPEGSPRRARLWRRRRAF